MYHRRIQCRRNAFSSSSGSTPVFQETYCTWPLSFLLPPGKPHSILKCWLRVCCIFVCPKMAWLPMLGYTHAQMFMHAIARRSRTNTLGESAPKPNSGIKIHCVTGSQIWTTGQNTQPTKLHPHPLSWRGPHPGQVTASPTFAGEPPFPLTNSPYFRLISSSLSFLSVRRSSFRALRSIFCALKRASSLTYLSTAKAAVVRWPVNGLSRK